MTYSIHASLHTNPYTGAQSLHCFDCWASEGVPDSDMHPIEVTVQWETVIRELFNIIGELGTFTDAIEELACGACGERVVYNHVD